MLRQLPKADFSEIRRFVLEIAIYKAYIHKFGEQISLRGRLCCFSFIMLGETIKESTAHLQNQTTAAQENIAADATSKEFPHLLCVSRSYSRVFSPFSYSRPV
jgi:hypothetical protein